MTNLKALTKQRFFLRNVGIIVVFAIYVQVNKANADPFQPCVCQRAGALWRVDCESVSLVNVANILETATGIHFDVSPAIAHTPVTIKMDKASLNQILDEILAPFNFTAELSDKINPLYSKIQLVGLKSESEATSVSRVNKLSMIESKEQQLSVESSLGGALSESSDNTRVEEQKIPRLSELAVDSVVQNTKQGYPTIPIDEAEKIKLDQEFSMLIASQRQDKANIDGAIPQFLNISRSQKIPMPLLGRVDPNNHPSFITVAK